MPIHNDCGHNFFSKKFSKQANITFTRCTRTEASRELSHR